MAYDINKDPNIVTNYWDWTYKRKDWERVDKYGIPIKATWNSSLTSKPKFNLFDFQTKVAWTNVNKVIPTTTAIATKVEPKRNIFTPSSPASMVKPVAPTAPIPWIPWIPKASANLETPSDDDIKMIETALQQWIPQDKAFEYLLEFKQKQVPIQPKETNINDSWLLDEAWQRLSNLWWQLLKRWWTMKEQLFREWSSNPLVRIRQDIWPRILNGF